MVAHSISADSFAHNFIVNLFLSTIFLDPEIVLIIAVLSIAFSRKD